MSSVKQLGSQLVNQSIITLLNKFKSVEIITLQSFVCFVCVCHLLRLAVGYSVTDGESKRGWPPLSLFFGSSWLVLNWQRLMAWLEERSSRRQQSLCVLQFTFLLHGYTSQPIAHLMNSLFSFKSEPLESSLDYGYLPLSLPVKMEVNQETKFVSQGVALGRREALVVYAFPVVPYLSFVSSYAISMFFLAFRCSFLTRLNCSSIQEYHSWNGIERFFSRRQSLPSEIYSERSYIVSRRTEEQLGVC